jgi:adenosylcobinamide-phosphate synthase/adenosylcobinamide-GDP ribazoletransferase
MGRAVVAAFQFLSRLPFPIQIQYTKEVFASSVLFYPLVGAVLGSLIILFGYGSALLFPSILTAVLTLVWTVSLTGALHLDGLMDTADGILSHRPREQMLEIMKDSRVGAMGVIVCVLAMMLKGTILFTLLDHQWTWKLILPFIWSRWFMVVGIVGWPYARKDSGLGSYFKGVGLGKLMGATIMAVIVSFVVLFVGVEFGPSSTGITLPDVLSILWIGGGALVFGWIIATYMNRKLGGLTGDTYGAVNELLEIILLMIGVAVF